jgi:rare lipoprotein A
MRKLAACVAMAAIVLFACFPAAAGAASSAPSLGALRAQRATLLRRIAALTDDAFRAQARAAATASRLAAARAAAEDARLHVARYAVDAYVDGVQATQVDQLRRNGWADIASQTDRRRRAALLDARRAAQAEEDAAAVAVDAAREATDEVQRLRTQLEQTIVDREAADAAATAARRAATPSAKLTARPRFARTTQRQSELFARFAFGPVASMPAGLLSTGRTVSGPASWYGPGFDGRPTASGAIFDQEGPTVASKELPLGTILLIHYNGRSVLALVNDRGPYVAGRVLDLSHGVAVALGTVQSGVARVTAEVLAIPE